MKWYRTPWSSDKYPYYKARFDAQLCPYGKTTTACAEVWKAEVKWVGEVHFWDPSKSRRFLGDSMEEVVSKIQTAVYEVFQQMIEFYDNASLETLKTEVIDEKDPNRNFYSEKFIGPEIVM